MTLTIFFAVIAFTAVGWYIVAGIMIVNELMKRKQKIQFIFINVMLPVYAHRYKKITMEETGKVGSLFYHWLIAINTALVFGIAAIAIKIIQS
jgi:hypothetical protein